MPAWARSGKATHYPKYGTTLLDVWSWVRIVVRMSCQMQKCTPVRWEITSSWSCHVILDIVELVFTRQDTMRRFVLGLLASLMLALAHAWRRASTKRLVRAILSVSALTAWDESLVTTGDIDSIDCHRVWWACVRILDCSIHFHLHIPLLYMWYEKYTFVNVSYEGSDRKAEQTRHEMLFVLVLSRSCCYAHCLLFHCGVSWTNECEDW